MKQVKLSMSRLPLPRLRRAVKQLLALLLLLSCGVASASEHDNNPDCPLFLIDKQPPSANAADNLPQQSWPINTTTAASAVKGTYSHYRYHARFCFRVRNATAQVQQYAAYLQNARIYHAELVEQSGQVIRSSVIGIDYPLSFWETPTADAVFTMELAPGTESRYELLMGSELPYNSTLLLVQRNVLNKQLTLQKSLTGCLAGMIGILTIYFLFVAFSTRDKTYFYLAGSTATATLLQLSDLGLLFPLWPLSLHWNQSCSAFFGVLSTLFGNCLARHYLNTEETLPRTDKALRLLAWYMLLVTLPLSLSEWPFLILPLFVLPALLFMCTLFVISIVRIRQGFRPARLYLIAYLLPLVSGIAIVLTVTGALPSSPWSHLLPIGSTALQLILFALALGERINWLNEERNKAHYAALKAKTEMQTKRHFLAQISHELRTPLIGIIGLTAMIDRKAYAPADVSLINGMESSARHLLALTNTLLDHARLDAGKWVLAPVAFSVRALFRDIVDQSRPAALAKQLEISCHIHDNVPDTIVSDPDVLARILREIIDNAIKFTSRGSIVVMLERQRSENSQQSENQQLLDVLRFEVVDTGIGFDADFQARLFGMFEMADQSSTRQQQGSGLGLSVSKKFCTLLGGHIGCESHPDEGTVFWFRIPFTWPEATTSQQVAQHAPQLCHLRDGYSILVAEDDAAIQLIVAALLDSLGSSNHQVFEHGKGLLDRYCQQPADVAFVLLDWNMPVMNARQTLQAIRAFEASQGLPAVPVAIMSAHDAHSQLSQELEPGIPVLYKPLTTSNLKHILNMV